MKRSEVARSEDTPEFSKAGFAYQTLRKRILQGTYPPGERLRLTQLAHELNLSEMPIREALRVLQKDGLVVIHLHRGAEVAKLSYRHGLEVTETRMTLEQAAALAALPYQDAASITAMERRLAELERSASRPVKFAVKNRAFCTAMYARCPNTFMRQQIEELWDQVWQASSTSVFEVMQHRVQETIDENRAILLHTKQGNTQQLKTVLQMRLRKTITAWRQAIEQNKSPALPRAAATPAKPASRLKPAGASRANGARYRHAGIAIPQAHS